MKRSTFFKKADKEGSITKGMIETALGVIALSAILIILAVPTHSDEFGCNYNLCDSSYPCNRGCYCKYPDGATVGYCRVWYDRKATPQGEEATTQAKKYTCYCESQCSGSITCDTGCYAYCVENPEGSGRYVCVKGCASEVLKESSKEEFSQSTKFASVSIDAPRYVILPLLRKSFGADAVDRVEAEDKGEIPGEEIDPEQRLQIRLEDTNGGRILREGIGRRK